MTGAAELVQDQLQEQRRYLQLLKDALAAASGQVALLSNLSLHHGEAIGRQQVDAARATQNVLQELVPKFLVPKVADEFSEYIQDCGQRWILFSIRCVNAATPASCARKKASGRSSPSTTR